MGLMSHVIVSSRVIRRGILPHHAWLSQESSISLQCNGRLLKFEFEHGAASVPVLRVDVMLTHLAFITQQGDQVWSSSSSVCMVHDFFRRCAALRR